MGLRANHWSWRGGEGGREMDEKRGRDKMKNCGLGSEVGGGGKKTELVEMKAKKEINI